MNHAEAKGAAKRGSDAQRMHLDAAAAEVGQGASLEDIAAVDEALRRLEALDTRKGRIVEAKIFGGLTHQEIADAPGVSLTTVESDWRMAKAWLAKELRA